MDVPLNLALNISAGENEIQFEMGPYAAVGLFGFQTEGDESETLTFGENEDLNRFGGGVNLGLTYKLAPIALGVAYNLGMISIVDNGNSGIGNRVLSLNLSYYFAD